MKSENQEYNKHRIKDDTKSTLEDAQMKPINNSNFKHNSWPTSWQFKFLPFDSKDSINNHEWVVELVHILLVTLPKSYW